jgi:hypothetical protein
LDLTGRIRTQTARRGAVPRKNKQIDKCQKQCHRR